MNLIPHSYQTADLDSMRKLWNQIVEKSHIQLGTIPGGFRRKDGKYVDICPLENAILL